MNIFALFSNQSVIMLAQALWGIAVKRLPGLAIVPNKLIPAMNLVVGFIAAVLAPKIVAPVAMLLGVHDAYAQATNPGPIGTAGAVLFNPWMQSYLSNVVLTAHHSFLKNTWQWLKTALVPALKTLLTSGPSS